MDMMNLMKLDASLKKCITIGNCSKAGVENYFDWQATSPVYGSSTDNMPTAT